MDKFPEAFARFEKSEIDLSKMKDSNDLIRQFRYWQNRGTTTRQDLALRHIAEDKGIKIIRGRGISERKGVSRKELKKHYTVVKRKGKTFKFARIPKGQKGAGRFTKK